MSRIMCLEECPFKSKTGYCRYCYCEEKPFFLYKDGVYAQIKSNKTVLDKNKMLTYLTTHINQETTLKRLIEDGAFDVDIKDKENRYKDEHIKVEDAAEYVFNKLGELGISCHCDKDAHLNSIMEELIDWKNGNY